MADVMEREENPPPNNLWEWLLSNASKLRDLALAGAAGTYALGFIIWSIHASVNNLGLLPALDSQYIIAGILPVTILGLAVTAVYVTIKRKNLRLRVFAVAGCVSLFLGFGFSIVGFYFLNISEALISTVGTILGSISWLMIFIGAYAAIVRWAADILPPRDLDLFLRFFVVVLTLWSVIMGISEYASVVYPNFPHSLGGAKPRCAHLDVDISKISPGSRSALFSADGDASTIKRSEEVGVYYAGDNWVLVKKVPAGPAEGLSFRFISWLRSLRNAPTAEAPTAELKDSATSEIDRDAINAIIWC